MNHFAYCTSDAISTCCLHIKHFTVFSQVFGGAGCFFLNLPRSPHGSADSLRAGLRSAGSHCDAAAAAGLALQSGAEAGFEAQESLLDLRESPGALSAAVQAGWGDGGGGGRGLLDEFVHPLTRILVQARFGKQSGDALEAGFVAFLVTVCGI